MTIDDAISQACSEAGIVPPKARTYGKWIKADTRSGRNGKGDGRLILDDRRVTAHNWQTGQSVTVWLQDGALDKRSRQRIAQDRQRADVLKRERAAEAAAIANRMMSTATLSTHPYLGRKGFPTERMPVIDADNVRRIGGDYLVTQDGQRAVIMAARRGAPVTSVQLIWEDGTKKFLAGGEIAGTSHRIAAGHGPTWLCEGLATGLSIRAALGHRGDTILCCFSASNLAAVAKGVRGRVLIAADNDKPQPQFGGLGTGEHFARLSGKPYVMPPEIGQDFNDFHQAAGIFALQGFLSGFIREAA